MVEDIPEGSELEKKLSIYFKFDNEYRGTFLASATQGESFLVDAIAEHFESNNKEKRSVLISLILSQLSFNKKIRIFSHLLHSNYSEILKAFPTIEKELESVREFRNKMAHYAIDSKTEPVMKYAGEKLSLEYHRNGKLHHEIISKETFEEKISLSRRVTASLAEIQEMIHS